ncbi:MAG: glycosyltransferase family 2 protein [Candidatus Bathyarchaeia archaeon]
MVRTGTIRKNIDVSVVILTRNSQRTLEPCVRSAIRERPKEILAVDTQSTDRTLSILTKYGVRVLSSPSMSLGCCRQLGVGNATGEFVMFLDSDAELGQGCIKALRSELKASGWAGIHAQILSQEIATYWQRSEHELHRRFHNRAGPKGYIGCMAALYWRSLILSHAFDARMRLGEDVDLCRTLARDKYAVGVSTARAVVYHLDRRELSAFARQRFNYGRYGGARRFRKYKSSEILISPFISLGYGFSFAMKYRRLGLVPYLALHSLFNFLGIVVGLSRASRNENDVVAFA